MADNRAQITNRRLIKSVVFCKVDKKRKNVIKEKEKKEKECFRDRKATKKKM